MTRMLEASEQTLNNTAITNDDSPTYTGKRTRNDMDDFNLLDMNIDDDDDDDDDDDGDCGEDDFSLSQDEVSGAQKKICGNDRNTSFPSQDIDGSKYVRLCQLLQHEGNLTLEVILNAIEKEYSELYDEWRSLLLSSDSPQRQVLIEEKCSCKDVGLKVLFNILRSWEYINYHPRGKDLWKNRANNFETRFSTTIHRVLTDSNCKRSVKYRKRNPFLLGSLQAASVYVSHMLESMELNRNLCFFLCIASCIEGRGKYHGRSSKNLSILHKSYRYMIEIVSKSLDVSCVYLSSIPEHERKPAEKVLIATFEENI